MATNKKKFLKLHGLPETTSLSIDDMSNLSGIPAEALQIIFNRGVGAWKENISSVRLKSGEKNYDTAKYPRQSRMSKEKWAGGRLYAFLMKTKKVYYGSDNDVREAYGLE
jgi:hypothetical protein